MRLIFVAETLSYGGAARRFVGLANAMVQRNHHVELLLYGDLIDINEKIDNEIKINNIKINYESKNWFQRNIIYRQKTIKEINKYFEKNVFDVVISFNDMVNINMLLSRAKSSCKILISERSDPYYNARYLQIIKKWLFKKADGIVFQTEGARDFFDENLPVNTRIIPNPIPSDENFSQFEGIRQKKIVSVARLWLYQKRQDILLKAFKEFSKKYNDYKLVLYGDGPDCKKIEKLIIDLNLEQKVIIAGVKKDIIDLIKDAELFVLSSDFEGIPNALIEAMSVGLPVISTKCSPGGAEFLINNNINGLLVECGDSKNLFRAMDYIIKNPDKAKLMGSNATEIVKELDQNIIYDNWESFIFHISMN